MFRTLWWCTGVCRDSELGAHTRGPQDLWKERSNQWTVLDHNLDFLLTVFVHGHVFFKYCVIFVGCFLIHRGLQTCFFAGPPRTAKTRICQRAFRLDGCGFPELALPLLCFHARRLGPEVLPFDTCVYTICIHLYICIHM